MRPTCRPEAQSPLSEAQGERSERRKAGHYEDVPEKPAPAATSRKSALAISSVRAYIPASARVSLLHIESLRNHLLPADMTQPLTSAQPSELKIDQSHSSMRAMDGAQLLNQANAPHRCITCLSSKQLIAPGAHRIGSEHGRIRIDSGLIFYCSIIGRNPVRHYYCCSESSRQPVYSTVLRMPLHASQSTEMPSASEQESGFRLF